MSTGVGTRPEAVPAEVFQCTSLKQQAFVFSNSSGCSIFAADNPGGTEQRKRTWQPKPRTCTARRREHDLGRRKRPDCSRKKSRTQKYGNAQRHKKDPNVLPHYLGHAYCPEAHRPYRTHTDSAQCRVPTIGAEGSSAWIVCVQGFSLLLKGLEVWVFGVQRLTP